MLEIVFGFANALNLHTDALDIIGGSSSRTDKVSDLILNSRTPNISGHVNFNMIT
jgi:hypothetical protein